MINKLAVYHKPMSNYAFALDENTLVIRLRTARENVEKVWLHYGDTAYPANPMKYDIIKMQIVAQDELYDYFEARITNAYKRCIYYFELVKLDERLNYYSGFYYKEISQMRNDLYKFPFNRREDIADAPSWLKNAVIYNIFPDSFVQDKQSKPEFIVHKGNVIKNRLGGTLTDVLKGLDYIQSLGFNTIYLNPIFTAGEYHKYDLINYYEIDPMFGSNKDFKNLVKECHRRSMKVIIDGVFNHSGWNFFAFKDVLKNQEKSKYIDWYYGLKFPVEKPKNNQKPSYDSFGYEKKMPKLNTSNREVVKYFMDVCKYWITEYDIDGWRLDVADEVNADFWREFRKTAKEAKKDCALIGEVWQNAEYYLDGTMFDSTMNYDFLKHAKDFFAYKSIDAYQLDGRMTDMRMRYRENLVYAQLNLLDSHDVPRFLSIVNSRIDIYKLAVILLMTSIGTPSVFYGDCQGLEGIKELDYRREMDFNKNPNLAEFYKKLIYIRHQYSAIRNGEFKTIQANKKSGLYMFKRSNDENSLIIAINNSDKSEALSLPNNPENILLSEGLEDKTLNGYGYLIYEEKKGVI